MTFIRKVETWITNSKQTEDGDLAAIKEANRLSSKNKWYLYEYAQILFQNNKYQESTKQYERLVEMEPKNKKYYFLLAESQIYQNKLKEAIKTYNL